MGRVNPCRCAVSVELALAVGALIVAAAAAGVAIRGRSAVAGAPDLARLDDVGRSLDEVGRTLAAMAARQEALGAGSERALDLRQGAIDRQLGEVGRSVSGQVDRMSNELERFRSVVEGLKSDDAERHGQLVEGLRTTILQSREVAQVAAGLRDALLQPGVRGQWGERMAEDVLLASGMRPGINYVRGQTLASGTRPDYTFVLPEGRHLHMDVKFPLVNYLRALEQDAGPEQDALVDRFLGDVKGRVKELARRDYAQPDATPGFVLMFIPNEGVYSIVLERAPSLLDEALGLGVVPCAPSSLFAVLAVIRQAVDAFALNESSGELLAGVARFEHQWNLFADQLDKVARNVDRLHNSVADLNGPRRRQLDRHLAELHELGS